MFRVVAHDIGDNPREAKMFVFFLLVTAHFRLSMHEFPCLVSGVCSLQAYA